MKDLTELGGLAAEVVNSDTVAFISWYKNGRLLSINPPFSHIIGYSKEEMGEMRWPDDFCTPDTANHITIGVDTLDKGEKAYQFDGLLVCKDDSIVDVQMFVHKYVPSDGEPFYFSFVTDITEHVHSELVLTAAKAQADLYVDLMSHDIRNMNQIAQGYLEMAIHKVESGEKLDKRDITLLKSPFEALQRVSQLIDNVKKYQSKRFPELKYTAIDLGPMLEEVKDLYASLIEREIIINYAPMQCRVKANELLKEVFSNLVGNAIKHSIGPVEITVGLTKVASEGRKYCQVKVEDNGHGIPDELKKNLLTGLGRPFGRTNTKGLGLSLSKTLVEDFHGKMWIEDRVPGDHTKGARFVVLLPAINHQ
jgi:PAS domain S-box-containing protein